MQILKHNWLIRVLRSGGGFGLILLGLINFLDILYLFPGTSSILTDADLIQLPTMFLDLQVNIGNFWGWKLPDAPYYFPDTIVFLLINFLVQNSWWSMAIYSLVQIGLLILSLYWLHWELQGRKPKVFLIVCLGTLLIFSKIYTSIFSYPQGLITPYIYSLSSYIHFGTYVCSLTCLAGSLNYIRTEKKLLLLIVVFISILTTASDLIFVVYFTIPFIVTINLGITANLLARSQTKYISYILFFASFIAYIFNKYIDPLAATTTVEIRLDKILLSINTMVHDLLQAPLNEKLFLTATILLPLMYLSLYIFQLNQKIKTNNTQISKNNIIWLVCLFIILGCSCNLFAVIILGKYTTIPHTRYLLFLYYSPSIISLVLISLNLEKINNKYFNNIITGMIVLLSLITFSSLFTQKWQPITRIISPPDYAACFNFNKPSAGLAGYWQSKPLITFSQRKIQIATINEQGEPSIGNNNRYWYTDSWQNPGSLPQFQFIFMNSLDYHAIANRYGNPDKIETCIDSEIWWYDNPQLVYSKLMQEGL
jgi:hypothetical protein